MKKKIFAITLCALIATASIVDNSYVVAQYIFGDKAGGY